MLALPDERELRLHHMLESCDARARRLRRVQRNRKDFAIVAISTTAPNAQRRRGRKPADESRAAGICTKLLAWRQTPEPQRISLRALAIQIGTSHQLLSFHLRRLDEWQSKEYKKKAEEIRARSGAENRPMTQEEERQCAAYRRASLVALIDSILNGTLTELRKQIKHGTLSGAQVKTAKVLARRGHREAQEILNVHFQRKNNLPAIMPGGAKPFRTDTNVPGNSAKRVSRAFS